MMRLAKAFAGLAVAVAILAAAGSFASAQGQQPKKPAPKVKTAPKAKAAAAGKKAVAPKRKSAAAAPAKPAAAAVGAPAPAPAEDKKFAMEGKRDPFVPLINTSKGGPNEHLPPGKAGLEISTVHVDGTVQSQGGMIAVVSNPEQRVYFVREGDRLYDGDVEKISLDGVTFRENSKDAFGKPMERDVTKRIYPSAGEQQ